MSRTNLLADLIEILLQLCFGVYMNVQFTGGLQFARSSSFFRQFWICARSLSSRFAVPPQSPGTESSRVKSPPRNLTLSALRWQRSRRSGWRNVDCVGRSLGEPLISTPSPGSSPFQQRCTLEPSLSERCPTSRDAKGQPSPSRHRRHRKRALHRTPRASSRFG